VSPIAAKDDDSRAFRAHAIRVVLACVAVGLVVAIMGGARSLLEAAVMVVEIAVGAMVGLAVGRVLSYRPWFRDRVWARLLAVTCAITIPMTVLVTSLTILMHGQSLTLELLRQILPTVFAISLMMTGLAMLVRQPTRTHAAPAGAPPPKFFARLPNRLQGGELYAVEAEDHYLRLHTSLGQDLILLRLADAIAELEGVEGAQTHRSWWVAKSAVMASERGDGRATLTLKDGSEAPVSRGFAKELRAAGWF
jgi:hypothetical protein